MGPVRCSLLFLLYYVMPLHLPLKKKRKKIGFELRDCVQVNERHFVLIPIVFCLGPLGIVQNAKDWNERLSKVFKEMNQW